jgi:hypothetical protein
MTCSSEEVIDLVLFLSLWIEGLSTEAHFPILNTDRVSVHSRHSMHDKSYLINYKYDLLNM